MKLVLDRKQCGECSLCLKNCPNGLGSVNAFNCVQCEERNCVEACKRNAFFEAAEGIYSIDSEMCDGCMECIQECPFNAIELVKGKAVKCDLCQEKDFFLNCLRDCPKDAIKVMKTEKEKREIEKLLGWRVKKRNAARKRIVSGELFEISEGKGREMAYLLKGFPDLTKQEARLVKEVKEEFQRAHGEEKGNKNIEVFLQEFCEERALALEEEQRSYLLDVLSSLIYFFGPIGRLLESERIEEIAVIGLGERKPVYVFDRAFGWMKTNLHFSQEKEVVSLVNRMARNSGRRLSLQTPRLNSVLPDGNRLNAVIAPVSFTGPSLTIRKFKEEPFTPLELVRNKTFSLKAMAFLWMLMEIDSNVLIAGNTGSGKTSTLNALFSFAPKNDRVVVAEETPEVKLPQRHLVKLNEVSELEIGMRELIIESLRMRPDKIMVGEVRSREEVQAFIDTLLAGQGKGSYATFHAQSAMEAVKRFRSFGVSDLDLGSVDLILVQKRWTRIDLGKGTKRELRRATELIEVNCDSSLELNPLFEYSHGNDSLVEKNESRKIIQKFMNAYSLTRKGVLGEIKRREQFLKKNMHREMGVNEFFELVGGYGKGRA